MRVRMPLCRRGRETKRKLTSLEARGICLDNMMDDVVHSDQDRTNVTMVWGYLQSRRGYTGRRRGKEEGEEEGKEVSSSSR